jgi:iron(III) transport system ATP-binding protein
MVDLVVKDLVKRFNGVTVVDHVSLHVADGEFVSLLGPSGCGKSTTLAAIAGLDRPDGGLISAGETVYFSGQDHVYLPPELRDCGLVFQTYALWPHMTVYDNVAFPLKLRKITGDAQKRRVAEVLELVEMGALAHRYPHELSGGQQQRVALARTLGYSPKLLLLDEPLSNLDAKLRDRARIWLAELRTKLKITTIYVTHDQVEALSLSDRIVVMNGGKVAQIGTPQDIYERPADPFVADFIGTTNFLNGRIGEQVRTGTWRLQLNDGQVLEVDSDTPRVAGDDVTLALRPAQIGLHPARGPDGPTEGGTLLTAQVTTQSYVGARWQIALQLAGDLLRLESDQRIETEHLQVLIPRHGGALFAGRTTLQS